MDGYDLNNYSFGNITDSLLILSSSPRYNFHICIQDLNTSMIYLNKQSSRYYECLYINTL